MSFGRSPFGAASFGDYADAGVADTTAPTLTSPTATATGSTTATGTVTTDEANGTLYRLASTNATETAATVVAAALSQTVTATGSQAVSFTGLTASTTYYAHYVHDDAASNRSARVSSSSFTTSTPDTTAPALSSGVGTVKSNSLIVIGATTDEANGTMYAVLTTSTTPPDADQVEAGTDHLDAAAAWDDSQAISSTGAKTFNALGPAPLTGYYPYIMHKDAAGNQSAVMSIGLRTTFRDGATGQFIIDNTGPVGGNPAGAHYNKVVLPGDADKWFASREITPPATGVLTFNPDGTLIFIGPNYETTTRQLEVDGVDTPPGTPWTISLYDITSQTATPGNVTSVVTVTPSACTQGFIATPGPVTSLVSVTPSACTQTLPAAVATPLNLTSIVTVSPSFVRVLTLDPSANRLRIPADGNTRRYLGKFFKRPVEMDDYDVEAADYLATVEDTLISAEVTADPGITVDAFRLVGSFVKVWVSGGMKRGRYKLTVRVTTAEGRIKELKFMVVMPAG